MYLLSSTPNLGTFCLFQKSFNVKTKCTPFSLILTYNNELLVYHKYVDPAFTLIIAKLIMLFFLCGEFHLGRSGHAISPLHVYGVLGHFLKCSRYIDEL
jgi:hypothetical protein